MNFNDRTIILKNGQKCLLTPAKPDSAAEMIDYLKITAGESEFLLRYPDEITFTEEREREILHNRLSSPVDVMINAVVEGELAGNCSIASVAKPRRVRHRCEFAIALKKKFWRMGIGTALVDYAVELAEQMGYEQIELRVIEGNDKAKSFYEKMGFQVTGKILRAFKYDDGSYRDEFIMIKIL